MALNHDNDGFLLGERANLDEQLNILKSIKDDIHDIRASLHGVTTTPVQASVVDGAAVIPSQVTQSDSNNNDRVLLASLESSAQSLSAVQVDLSSMASSLSSIVDSIAAPSIESPVVPAAPVVPVVPAAPVVPVVPAAPVVPVVQRQPTEASSNESTRTVSSNGNDSPEPRNKRQRETNGRFTGRSQEPTTQEVSGPRGRDANGRFSGGDDKPNNEPGGKAGYISRLATAIGKAVVPNRHTVTDAAGLVNERIDPNIQALKEVAAPIGRTLGIASKIGVGTFKGIRAVVGAVRGKEDKDKKKKKKKKKDEEAAVATPRASRRIRNDRTNQESAGSEQEITQPVAETVTARPSLRARDERGRFIRTSSADVSEPTRSRNDASRRTDTETVTPSTAPTAESPVTRSRDALGRFTRTITATPSAVVAEPNMRGLSSTSSSRAGSGSNSIFKNILSSMNVTRREQTAYGKASLKLLKEIAGHEESPEGRSGSKGLLSGLISMVMSVLGPLGGMIMSVLSPITGIVMKAFSSIGGLAMRALAPIGGMIMTALSSLGAAILPAISAVLSVVFSPIGLAIAAAATLAWGLFTEDGRKFFSNVGKYISDGWDASIAFIKENFQPVFDAGLAAWTWVTDAFAPVIKIATDLFDGLAKTWKGITDTIGNVFTAFSAFLKDKFGIDIPAIVDAVVTPVVAVVDATKELGNKATEAVKETGSKVWEGAKNFGGKALEGAKNIGYKVADTATTASDYVGKKVRQGTFNEVDSALAFKGGGSITGLSDVQTRALAANTAKTESGGKVDADNKQGYFGQYQFGAEALTESGLVNGEKLAAAKKASGKDWYKKRSASGEVGGHEAFLRDKSNWNTEGGLDGFLQDKSLQDQAFVKYTNKNVAGGVRSGAISKDDSAEQIAGYSKAAHLKGVGGANKLFKNGIESTDGNGTSTKTYANQAAKAMTETVTAINAKVAKGEKPAETKLAENKAEKPPEKSTIPTLTELAAKKDGVTSPQDQQINAFANAEKGIKPTETVAGTSLQDQQIHAFANAEAQNKAPAISVSAAMPAIPKALPIPAMAEANAAKEPITTNSSRNQSSVTQASQEVGQDLSDRSIAHIVSGGYSRG